MTRDKTNVYWTTYEGCGTDNRHGFALRLEVDS